MNREFLGSLCYKYIFCIKNENLLWLLVTIGLRIMKSVFKYMMLQIDLIKNGDKVQTLCCGIQVLPLFVELSLENKITFFIGYFAYLTNFPSVKYACHFF